MLMHRMFLVLIAIACVAFPHIATAQYDAAAVVAKLKLTQKIGKGDWGQWAGSSHRNSVSSEQNIPTEWDVASGQNVRWSMALGTETYGNPVIANGKVYVGTNNGAGYVARYPKDVDLGVLLCFSESDGKFLWQHSNEKLPQGRVNDWPHQGICCAPLVDGDRLWYVTSRGEVVCLDTEGFHDGENDGEKKEAVSDDTAEADVVWSFDMMDELGTFQHNMCSCSVTCAGDLLFVHTANGTDESQNIPAAEAPSFICLNKNTGKIVWTDNSPGKYILHGQWSSPAYGVLGGVPQVLFGGGDGWLYSFAAEGENGKSKLLWKFDCNPKESVYSLGGSATRNHIIATPVIYNGLVYVSLGEDPEQGDGQGHLWCIDPTKRGDVSPTLVYNNADPNTPIARKRLQALVKEDGDFEKPNPNSAAVWHYMGSDPEEFETTMHRTCGTVAIKDDILFVADFSGMFHCLNAKTGEAYWTYDMFAASWASPLIIGDRVYISDEDGDIAIFDIDTEGGEPIQEINMETAVYTSPVAANSTLFISNRNRVYAIQEGAQAPSE